MNIGKHKNLILLHVVILLYSIASVFSKITAQCLNQYGLFSWQTVVSGGLIFVFMGAYAIFWQRIIKKMELSVAYMNKGITVVWSLIWSAILFHEKIGWNNIIGTALIVIGIVVLAGDKNE